MNSGEFERQLLSLVTALSLHLRSEIFLNAELDSGQAEISDGKNVLARINVRPSHGCGKTILIYTALARECNIHFVQAFESCTSRVFKPL